MSREQAIVLIVLTVPWALLGLTALLRGYTIGVWLERRRQRGDEE